MAAHELRVQGDKVFESDGHGHVLATKDYSHVHAGYVATTHNPRVSQEAKQTAEQMLHDLEIAHGDHEPKTVSHGGGVKVDEGDEEEDHEQVTHRHRQIGAYKGILHKKDVSAEAKQHAREQLEAFGVDPSEYE